MPRLVKLLQSFIRKLVPLRIGNCQRSTYMMEQIIIIHQIRPENIHIITTIPRSTDHSDHSPFLTGRHIGKVDIRS